MNKFFEENWKAIVFAVLTWAGGVAAAILTPLNKVLSGFLFREKARILLVSQNGSVQQGKILNLDVFIHPLSPIAISPGTLRILYPENLLRPSVETREKGLITSTSEMPAPIRLTKQPMEFIAVTPGMGYITAILSTRVRDFSEKIPVIVTAAGERHNPTLNAITRQWDFTGGWKVAFDGINGSMKIKETGGEIAGTYQLSDGSRGQVEGSHDGKTFLLTYYRGGAPSQYSIDGNFGKEDENQIVLRGTIVLKTPSASASGKWVNERIGKYEASSLID